VGHCRHWLEAAARLERSGCKPNECDPVAFRGIGKLPGRTGKDRWASETTKEIQQDLLGSAECA